MNAFRLLCLAILTLFSGFPKTTAQTFAGQGGLPFPPGAPAQTTGNTSSFAVVSGVGALGACLQIDNVTIDLVHTWVGDIAIFLISPSGTVLELSSGNGGAGDNYQVTTFSDAAFAFITAGAPPFNGGFRPEGRQQDTNCFCSNANAQGTFTFANTFDGENADGAWQLLLVDYVTADVGTLNSWSITFAANGTGPVAIPQMVDVCDNCAGWAQVDLTNYNNAVNGGSGSIVNWWADPNATLSVPNPASVQIFGGSYWATVQDGSCESAPVEVDFTLVIPNCGANASLSACNTGNGTGVFDLTSVDNVVNLGTNDQVNWYADQNATIPIANPAAYISGVERFCCCFDGTCPSFPRGVTLTVTQGSGSANPAALNECDGGTGQAVYNLTTVESVVNGGSGAPVSWWADAGATVPIANPVNFASSGGTVYATVNQGACSSLPAPVSLSLSPAPTAVPYPLDGCDNGGGTGTFDLTSIENFVNLSTGFPVSWFTDPAANNPIANPGSYQSAEGPVYAVVDNGACTSAPTAIPLNLVPTPNIGNATISPNPSSFCGPGTVLITFSMPEGGVPFEVTMEYGNPGSGFQTYTGVNVFDGSTVPFVINETTEFLLTSVSVPNNGFCSVAFSNPIPVTVSANSPPTLVLTLTPTVCAGETSDLSTVVSTPSGLPINFHTATPPTPANQLPSSVIAPPASTIYYAFVDDGAGCTNQLPIPVTVTPASTPQLGSATVCESEASVDLTTLQDPAFPAGTWIGPGVSGSVFSPAGLTGTITLSFEPFAPCSEPGATTIDVLPEAAPSLGTASVCASGSGVNLTALQDPAFPSGAWIGPGVAGNFFNPQGQSGPVALTFAPNSNCGLPVTTIISVNQPPATAALEVACAANNANYTVSFNISGGAPGSYVVNGQPSGPAFASPPIPSGSPYSFQVDDGNGCGPVAVTGSFNCDCATFAGSMNQAGGPVEVCGDAAFTASFNNNALLDGNDVLLFVLHDAPGGALGNVLAVSATPTFGLPAGGLPGTTYYISAVAGNDDGSGSFDPADGCLSVASGVPVVFYDVTAGIGPGGSICTGECFELDLSFSGVAPFVFSYETITPNGSTTETLDASQPNAQLTVCPDALGVAAGQISIRPISLTDANGCNVSFPGNQDIAIEVLSAPSASLSPTLCPGERLTVNGTIYDASNPTGTEVIPTGSVQGCDSTVIVNLSFYPDAVGELTTVLCSGGSIEVNGTVYDEANPAATEIIPGGSAQGCDSLLNVSLSFFPEAVGLLSPVLCTGGSIIVNGTVYDESNPSGVELLPGAGANGCDSLVEVALSFNDAVSSDLAETLCPGGSLEVNGTVYDAANPAGTEVFPNGSVQGCDSIVNVSLRFFPEAVSEITTVLCPGGSLEVNGTVYDAANPAGTEVFPNGSAQGCDSIVNVSLSFFPEAVGQLSPVLCTGGSVIVNGTVYNESNPSGVELLPGAGTNGCDSLVEVALSFNDAVSFDLAETLCPGGSIEVNGTVYDAANPAGTEVFPNGSAQGCDSIVNVSLSFHPEAVFELVQTLGPGGSIIVNGTVYDEANPAGTEVLGNAAANGCDSMVFISLSFEAVALALAASAVPPTCAGEEDGQVIIESISGGDGNYYIALNGQPPFAAGPLPAVIGGLPPGSYRLEVSDGSGLATVLTGTVPEAVARFLDLGDVVFIELGSDVPLDANTNITPASIRWEPTDFLSCTDCLSPVVEQPTADIRYRLILTDENGCTASDEVEIVLTKRRDIFIPNAFSPNGDGRNDRLTAFAGADAVRVRSFRIFDRWGGAVFEQSGFPPNDPSEGWDGTHQGEPLNAGVFVYFAEVEFLDGTARLFKGEVLLLR
ncbi:MAG: gliding motility-associated C-terminal domain-containing protein [Lewinellaceae bacterium]|nr:gliding motility-associated C-terminal domain-containing protein [Lewinellaceae bacterium]